MARPPQTTTTVGLQARLHSLPRDTRDTLFLLLVIGWIMLPQVERLPLWLSAIAGAILVWRGWIAIKGQSLPSRWWLLVLLLVATGLTFWSYRTLMGRDAGVTFIVLLLALKTLEMRAQRDAFVIFFLSFFTLLSNFFFSQSLLIAASMMLGLWGLLTALVNSHMPVGRPPLWRAAKTAGGMALLGTPIMVVLFVLFPRISPLWGMPGDAMAGRSGLSASMQVGTIANLALDDSIAMRIEFDGTPPRQSDLYFRGPVLSTFDGREWRPLRSGFPEQLQTPTNLSVQGEPIRYRVTLEPNNRPWVILLDASPSAPALPGYTTSMNAALQWTTDRPITDLVRYRAESYVRFAHGPLRQGVGLQDYLELPPGFNPRTLQWAVDMRRDPRYANADGATLVAALMDRLRTGGYTYTLDPGVYGANTADEFWFDRKEGFCEHIASSFVLMLRALDIPARIVTGYQGGETNAVDGFWTVRQSDAHAWAEVWLAGQGWVRVDPTSAVSPGRTGTLQRLQAPQSAIAQALQGVVSPQFSINLRASWEAMNNRWNQWVLNYTQAKQLNLLRNIGFESPSWEDLSTVLIGIIVVVSLCGAAWTLWERRQRDPWLRLLQGATDKLRHAGLALPDLPNAPPQATPRQLASALPATQTAIADWLLRLEAWRYAPHSTPLGTLQTQYRQLPWPARNALKTPPL
jgi:protein-glutamine gamma-glutamyltransferase